MWDADALRSDIARSFSNLEGCFQPRNEEDDWELNGVAYPGPVHDPHPDADRWLKATPLEREVLRAAADANLARIVAYLGRDDRLYGRRALYERKLSRDRLSRRVGNMTPIELRQWRSRWQARVLVKNLTPVQLEAKRARERDQWAARSEEAKEKKRKRDRERKRKCS